MNGPVAKASEGPVVDVIVPTWNKAELACRCAERLLTSSTALNVIVVDNGSEDGTAGRLKESFDEVTVIELPENLGYGRAVHAGLEAASSEFLAVVNNDVEVAPDYFERVLRLFDDPAVGFASGLATNPDSGLVDGAGATLDRGLSWYPIARGLLPDEVEASGSEMFAANSEAIIYRRSAFDEVQGYDEEFFAYGEDLDLALRLRGAGWQTALDPQARVVHLGSATLGTRSSAQMRLAVWGRGYVIGRYRLGPAWLMLDVVVGAVNCLLLRSTVPLGRLINGWRRGRSLPARHIPNVDFEPTLMALRKRLGLI